MSVTFTGEQKTIVKAMARGITPLDRKLSKNLEKQAELMKEAKALEDAITGIRNNITIYTGGYTLEQVLGEEEIPVMADINAGETPDGSAEVEIRPVVEGDGLPFSV